MKKHLLVALVGVALAASAFADIQDPPANDYGPTRKLGRGIGNFLYASSELPVTVCKVNKEEGNAAAASYGIVRGLGRSTARHFTGLFEIFTFPFPVWQDSYRQVLSRDINWIHAGYSEIQTMLAIEYEVYYFSNL